MPGKTLVLRKTDPVVEQFRAGVMGWERPHGETDGGAAAAKGAKAGRARGNVAVKKGARPVEALPEGDAVTKRFRDGAARWERPCGSGNEDD